METRTRILGQEHSKTLEAMVSLALTYRNQDQGKKADMLAAQVVKTKQRILGQEHPHTATSMGILAPIL